MTPGEIQYELRALGFDAIVGEARGKRIIALPIPDADALMARLRGQAPPPVRAPRTNTAEDTHEMPEELRAAMEANPEAEFVQSVTEQWSRTRHLTRDQLRGLERWGRRRGYRDG